MTSNLDTNYYVLLGVSDTASESDIRKAYKKKALNCHPDKAALNNMTVEKATEVFKKVQEAYSTLSDPVKRNIYDLSFNKIPTEHTSFDFNSVKETGYIPEKIDRGIIEIVKRDSGEDLDQFLKSNPFQPSILKSILYFACENGKFNVVKYLIEVRHLSPHLIIHSSGPVFKAAAISGNLELVRYLVEVHHVDIESQGLEFGTRDTALSRAAEEGHVDVVAYLISQKANVNPVVSYSNILNSAIDSDKLPIVQLLVEAGTIIGPYNLGMALEKGNMEIIQYLLSKMPDLRDHHFFGSLARAAIQSGNVSLVKYLEEKKGLDIFENDSHGELMIAAAKSHSIEMMKFLLDERGLKENPNYFIHVFKAAVEHGKQNALNLVRFLMEDRKMSLRQYDFEDVITNNARFADIRMNSYLQSYLQVDQAKKDHLLFIANHGLEGLTFAELLKLYNSKLVKKGSQGNFSSEVNCHIKERKLSLEYLREFFLENKDLMVDGLFYYSSHYYEDDIAPLTLLYELGVDLNSENANGIAVIHLALQWGIKSKIVQFFLAHDIDRSKKDQFGRTAEEVIHKKTTGSSWYAFFHFCSKFSHT